MLFNDFRCIKMIEECKRNSIKFNDTKSKELR